ncbi:MAG: protoporphyrinogen oxidase HemJ [Saprospiraceae bacterium]
MILPLFKALHIIGFVAWFAGLFYLVRIFVYHAEAKDKPSVEKDILIEQFKIMESRVYQLIATPAMFFTIFCGVGMLVTNPVYLTLGWMQIKLVFLVGLIAYHFYCKKITQELAAGTNVNTSFQFRLLNEVPTLILIAIVLLAVFRSQRNSYLIFGALLFLAILFYVIVKKYKNHREKNESRNVS